MKWRIWEDEVVVFDLERYKDLPFLHCTVKKLRPKYIDKVFEHIGNILYVSGARYVYAVAHKPSTTRFARLFGFRVVKSEKGKDLLVYKLLEPEQLKE